MSWGGPGAAQERPLLRELVKARSGGTLNQAEGDNSASLKWPPLYRCCTAVTPVHHHM